MTDLKERTDTDKAERDRVDSIWWAVVLIWVGIVLGAGVADILPEIRDSGSLWPWIFLGVGPWSLGWNLYLANTDHPKPTTWDWIWTAIFMLLALGTFVEIGGDVFFAAALIVVGGGLLWRAVRQ